MGQGMLRLEQDFCKWAAICHFTKYFLKIIIIIYMFEYWSMIFLSICNHFQPLYNIYFLLLFHLEIMARAKDYLDTYGDTIRAWLGSILVVFLANPSDIEIILSGNHHLEKSEEYRYFKPWFGNGLLISNGHHWRHHRKMIAPTFHQSILKSFIPTFVQHSKNVANRMSKEVGKEFDVHDYMSQATVEILLSTAMGVKNIPDNNKSLEYAKAVVDMCDIIHKRQMKFFYRLDSTYNLTPMSKKGKRMMDIILGMTRKVVNDRMKDFNADASAIIETEDELAKQKQQTKKVGLRDDLDDIDENDVGMYCFT